MIFPCTNNVVEYEGLDNGLKLTIEWKIKELHAYGDSHLVINQVHNEYQTKDEKLLPYKFLDDDIMKQFVFITLQQLPHAKNKATNAMANLSSVLQLEEHHFLYDFLVEEFPFPSYDTCESQIIYTIIAHDTSHYS